MLLSLAWPARHTELEPTIYHIRDKHVNHYITDAVNSLSNWDQGTRLKILNHMLLKFVCMLHVIYFVYISQAVYNILRCQPSIIKYNVNIDRKYTKTKVKSQKTTLTKKTSLQTVHQEVVLKGVTESLRYISAGVLIVTMLNNQKILTCDGLLIISKLSLSGAAASWFF